MNDKLKQLRDYLQENVRDEHHRDEVGRLLANCWDCFDGTTETNMRACKLIGRIEEPSWKSPVLEFSIERHGQTMLGSSRAPVYRWRVDLERRVASIVGEARRQLYPMDSRLDVNPIAATLADAIVGGHADPRIVRNNDGSVRLKIGMIIPETNQQTTQARRKRLRKRLSAILTPHGWKELRPNVYQRPAN